MSLEVTVGEEHLSVVLGDLAQRRGTVRDIQSRRNNKVLLANVPLAEMMVSCCPIHILFGFVLNDLRVFNWFYFKGLFHHFANAHIWQCHLLTGAGHIRGHELPGPEQPPEKNIRPAVMLVINLSHSLIVIYNANTQCKSNSLFLRFNDTKLDYIDCISRQDHLKCGLIKLGKKAHYG